MIQIGIISRMCLQNKGLKVAPICTEWFLNAPPFFLAACKYFWTTEKEYIYMKVTLCDAIWNDKGDIC